MTSRPVSGAPAKVVIVGGGVAALEALIGLRQVAGDRARITLVAPNPDFVYRPMLVAEPFGWGEAHRRSLSRIASDFDAHLVRDAVASVDPGARRIACRGGTALAYDGLVLAPGARARPAFEHAITIGEPDAGAALRDLLTELAEGQVRSVGFVAPSLTGWPLPLYEVALMTATWTRSHGVHAARLRLVTPEPRPLDAFGDEPSETIARLLEAAGIEFVCSTHARSRGRELHDRRGGSLGVDRAVALPVLRGPELDGVPVEGHEGFIPTDRHGRVRGLEAVYAAGDATDFPIKHGGLAAQQADAVVSHLAARLGVPIHPVPFRPVLHGKLLTGAAARYMRAGAAEARDPGTISAQPLWLPATKIAGRYLAPYLSARKQPEPIEVPARHATPIATAPRES
jgi:sulfide:quinone oxidoreductase